MNRLNVPPAADRRSGALPPGRTGSAEMPPNQPNHDLVSPRNTSAVSVTMYAYVGNANSRPDSLTPRRFASVMRRMITMHDRARDVSGGLELRDRDDRGDAGRDRHRDREDVVDEQRSARDQRRQLAEVLAADDVRTTAARVSEDRLAVRGHDDRQQDRDHDRDRHELRQPEREARRRDRDDEQDLFGRVRGRRDGVRREHRQRDGLR